MKKIILVLFIIGFSSSVCFTEKTSAQTDDSTTLDQATDKGTSTAVKFETFTGTIDSIWVENDAKSHISATNKNGHPTVFTVPSDAAIIGKDGSAITLTWVKGNNASIAYAMDQDGTTKIAKSIKVLPD